MAAGSATPESARVPALPRRGLRRYGARFAGILLATLGVHALLLWRMSEWLDAGLQASTTPPRLQAAFVREIQPVAAAPVAAPSLPFVAPAPVSPRAAPTPAAEPVVPAASAVEPVPIEAAASAPVSDPPQADRASAFVPSDMAAPGVAAQPFEWPVGTRLSYTLTGSVRGEVQGTAQVEWLRDGTRYQVHLDVLVGAKFAPLMQRRMTSDGEIGPAGLTPRRYDETTQIAFGRAREATVRFEPEAITLANGRRVEARPGVQDTASQFVQLTYLFATDASRLSVGHRIELPLALPRRVDPWVYEVMGEEELNTPFGPVRAWHVKPQREGDASTLSVEAWFAPTLRYLPVRIVIRQGRDDHLDLLVDRLPQEAVEEPLAGSAGR